MEFGSASGVILRSKTRNSTPRSLFQRTGAGEELDEECGRAGTSHVHAASRNGIHPRGRRHVHDAARQAKEASVRCRPLSSVVRTAPTGEKLQYHHIDDDSSLSQHKREIEGFDNEPSGCIMLVFIGAADEGYTFRFSLFFTRVGWGELHPSRSWNHRGPFDLRLDYQRHKSHDRKLWK